MGIPAFVNRATGNAISNLVVRTSQGSMRAAMAYNGNASTRYLMFFDAAALPGNGAVSVLPPVPIPANQTGYEDWGMYGYPFTTGIVAAMSTTDATLTIGTTDAQIAVTHDP